MIDEAVKQSFLGIAKRREESIEQDIKEELVKMFLGLGFQVKGDEVFDEENEKIADILWCGDMTDKVSFEMNFTEQWKEMFREGRINDGTGTS